MPTIKIKNFQENFINFKFRIQDRDEANVPGIKRIEESFTNINVT